MSEQIFEKQFANLIMPVFRARAAFQGAFGDLQVRDGVSESDTMFEVKTNDMPVVFGKYNTDENVAFKDGTANSSRFGKLTEIKYTNKQVPYDDTWAFHEGFDKFTVNADLLSAVADRLDLQAQEKTRLLNALFGKKLVAAAKQDLGTISDVVKTFGEAAKAYTDLEVTVPIRAYLSPEVYNEIVDATLTTSAKGSSVNIDTNGVVRLKGFAVEETPTQYMQGKGIIFAPDDIGKAFLGISTARTIDAIDFDGTALQGAGKYGAWIPETNAPAIFTAGTLGASGSTGKSK